MRPVSPDRTPARCRPDWSKRPRRAASRPACDCSPWVSVRNARSAPGSVATTRGGTRGGRRKPARSPGASDRRPWGRGRRWSRRPASGPAPRAPPGRCVPGCRRPSKCGRGSSRYCAGSVLRRPYWCRRFRPAEVRSRSSGLRLEETAHACQAPLECYHTRKGMEAEMTTGQSGGSSQIEGTRSGRPVGRRRQELNGRACRTAGRATGAVRVSLRRGRLAGP